MITISKYGIPNFEDVRNDYNFNGRIDLKYATYIACLYYEFAYHQMIGFNQTCGDFFKENPNEHNAINNYLNRSWSEAYATYALLRTCIEVVRKVNKVLIGEDQIDEFYKKRVRNIVDITNDIVKHPMFNDINNPADASMAYRPVSLSINGEIDIERWENQITPSSTLTIDPIADFESIGLYLEHIAGLLKDLEKNQ